MESQHSEKLDQLVEEILGDNEDFDLIDCADSSCTTGYDNDGSTGLEIFENGFDLGKAAGDRPIYQIDVPQESLPPIACFFIGTEEEIEKRIREALQDYLDNM